MNNSLKYGKQLSSSILLIKPTTQCTQYRIFFSSASQIDFRTVSQAYVFGSIRVHNKCFGTALCGKLSSILFQSMAQSFGGTSKRERNWWELSTPCNPAVALSYWYAMRASTASETWTKDEPLLFMLAHKKQNNTTECTVVLQRIEDLQNFCVDLRTHLSMA